MLPSFVQHMIWFHPRNKFRPATRQVIWIFIQHYYLFLNCVPHTYILLPSQAPHLSLGKNLSFAIVVPLSQGKNQPLVSILCLLLLTWEAAWSTFIVVDRDNQLNRSQKACRPSDHVVGSSFLGFGVSCLCQEQIMQAWYILRWIVKLDLFHRVVLSWWP